MEEEKIVLDENQEIEKNLLRDRAKKADDITDEKYNLCNKINRDMVEEYFTVNGQLSAESKKQYTSCLRQFFYFVYTDLRDKPFYSITKRDFMKFMAYLQGRGLSSSAQGLRKSAVSSFCNYIENIVADDMEECKMFRNFTRGLPAIAKTQTYEKKPVTEEEYEKMVKYLTQEKKYLALAWVVTAYNVGARRAELIQFKTEMLNYKPVEGANYIISHKVRGKGKSEQGKILEYMIPLQVLDVWKLWIDNRGFESEYIFATNFGGKVRKLGKSWADDLCSGLLSEICGRRINPHIFKSTCITHMLESGKSISLVSKYIAHHENVATTQSFYDLRNFDEEKKSLFD